MKHDPFRQYKRCRICKQNKLVIELIGSRCPDCIPTQKECTRCKIMKPMADYTIRNTASDGRSSWCKICHNRDAKAKKLEKKTAIKVMNPYRNGSLENEIYGFFAHHQLKLSKEEVKLICRELQQAESKLTTLDKILARYKVGIDDYLEEYTHTTSKAVLQYEIDDKDYEFPIGKYESLAEASICLRNDKSGIGSVSQSARTGGIGLGYRWRFFEE